MSESAAIPPSLPCWLPVHMRHTATPTDRLLALLSGIPELVRNDDPVTLAIRTKKIQHLCTQIIPTLTVTDWPMRLTRRQLLDILCFGAAFLEATGGCGGSNREVIASIYESATRLSEVVHRRPARRAAASASAHRA